MLLTTGEILTAINLLARWRLDPTGAERARLLEETAAFVDLPDIAIDVHVSDSAATPD